MRNPILMSSTLLGALLLSACASTGAPAGTAADGSYAIPDGAIEAVRTEDNGDVIHEYRVQGQLRMVKVIPLRGPTYYLMDRNGDGQVNREDGDAPAVYYKMFSW